MWTSKLSQVYSPVQRTNHAISHHIARPWEPGFWKRLPWDGLLSLIFGVGCGIAAIVIAVVSNGKPLDYWRVAGYHVQPTVLLSVLVTVANAFMAYAFTVGVTISWWTATLRKTTLRTLHSIQQQGNGFFTVFLARPVITRVTVASFFMLILLMDGPLLQRSISVVSPTRQVAENTSIPISPDPLPLGATGILADHNPDPTLYHPLFAKVLQQYNARAPIQIPNISCNGTCDTEIVAPGFDVVCNQWTTPYRLMTPDEYVNMSVGQFDTIWNSSYKGVKESQTMFSTNITYDDSDYATWNTSEGEMGALNYGMTFSTMYKSTTGYTGTLSWQNCTLREGIVRYPIHIANNTITLGAMPLSQNRTEQLIWRQLEDEGQGDDPSTLGGLYLAASTQYTAQSNMTAVGGWMSINQDTSVSSMYLQAPNASALMGPDVTWLNPMDDMNSMANELIFRTAIATTGQVADLPGLGVNASTEPTLTQAQPYIILPNMTLVNRTLSQNVRLSDTYTETVYQTERPWLAGGFLVIGFAFIAIIPTYWHFWLLGRNVSMSPLELAKAFDSPLLRNADPNGTASEILRAAGHQRVVFGVGAPRVEADGPVYEAKRNFTSVNENPVDSRSSLRSISTTTDRPTAYTGAQGYARAGDEPEDLRRRQTLRLLQEHEAAPPRPGESYM